MNNIENSAIFPKKLNYGDNLTNIAKLRLPFASDILNQKAENKASPKAAINFSKREFGNNGIIRETMQKFGFGGNSEPFPSETSTAKINFSMDNSNAIRGILRIFLKNTNNEDNVSVLCNYGFSQEDVLLKRKAEYEQIVMLSPIKGGNQNAKTNSQ